MSFTLNNYDLQLTIDFSEKTFTGKAEIHVGVTDPVKEVNLKISKNLDGESVSIWRAQHVYRGRADFIGVPENFVFDKENDSIHVTFSHEVNAESTKEGAYIEVTYKGKFGEAGDIDGIHYVEGITYEAKLNTDNVITVFPILEDISVPIKLSVLTPYRAGVETNIPAGEHHGVYNSDLFSNNFTTGEESFSISDLELRINAPTALILQ
uniref:Peptidase_M1_N domain-containing protein n=1 Tax=Caenorhabditis tropicalis TaxID=1561998 RepID=A0A1I7UW09_9PELO